MLEGGLSMDKIEKEILGKYFVWQIIFHNNNNYVEKKENKKQGGVLTSGANCSGCGTCSNCGSCGMAISNESYCRDFMTCTQCQNSCGGCKGCSGA